MKKHLLIASSSTMIALTIAAVLLVHPTRARGEEANAPGTEVRVDNFTFGPDTLTVPVNSTVTWVNKDDIPHVIASTEGQFKSKALDTDQKYSYTFTRAGTYPYYCSIHPKMVGKIVVQ
jgi:plastocyanin